MSKLILRDDDTSYWTSVEELDSKYGALLQSGVKLSLAVVPYSVEAHNIGKPEYYWQGQEAICISENRDLCDYLKFHVANGSVEIMLHGYSHQYYFYEGGERKKADKRNLAETAIPRKDIKFHGEFGIEDDTHEKKILDGKNLLEDLFSTKISFFVPPSNQMSATCVKVLDKYGINLSGAVGRKLNRSISLSSITSYLRMYLYWAIHGVKNPKPLKYRSHYELFSLPITPSANFDEVQRVVDTFIRRREPIQFATHYWELEGQVATAFSDLIELVLDEGYESILISDVFGA